MYTNDGDLADGTSHGVFLDEDDELRCIECGHLWDDDLSSECSYCNQGHNVEETPFVRRLADGFDLIYLAGDD